MVNVIEAGLRQRYMGEMGETRARLGAIECEQGNATILDLNAQ